MKIIKLELHKYLRFKVNPMDIFVIKPEAMIQLIVGTNGSGKSSILEEMSPLPSNANNFAKEGKSILEFTHRGRHYVKTSTFGPTRHSLIEKTEDGDIELNKPGTASIQKELVKELFGIDFAIHEMMTGTLTFTQMSPAERKKWFTRMSDTSYVYAIGVHNKLKSKLRDAQGASKYNQSRLSQEVDSRLKQEDIDQIEKELDELKIMLANMLNKKESFSGQLNTLEKQLYHAQPGLLKAYGDAINSRSRILNRLPKHKLTELTYTALSNRIRTIEDRFIRIDSERAFIDQDITKYQDELNAFRMAHGKDSTDIENNLHDLKERAGIIRDNQSLPIHFDRPKDALSALESVYDTLLEIFSTLPENPDRTITPKKLSDHKENYAKTFQLAEQVKSELDNKITLNKEFDYHKEHDLTTCPNCSHTWSQHYDPAKHRELEKSINIQQKHYQTYTEILESLEQSITKATEYLQQYRLYSQISKSTPILNPFWQYLEGHEIILKKPSSIGSFIKTLHDDLLSQSQLMDIEKQITELEQAKAAVERTKEFSASQLQNTIEALETRAIKLEDEREYIQIEHNELTRSDKLLTEWFTKANTLHNQLAQAASHWQQLEKIYLQQWLSELITNTQLLIHQRERILLKASNQQSVIDALQANQTELDEDVKLLTIMVEELDGIVIKGMTGFVNLFISQMNSFIKKIWTYSLEILAPGVDEANGTIELNYKFPLLVNDISDVPDINRGSFSMKEIINLAFVIVAMRYLGLSDSPLFLDEFASRMDIIHRANAYDAVNHLLAHSTFSNIFFISHYEDLYGSFTTAETTVVCSANIMQGK